MKLTTGALTDAELELCRRSRRSECTMLAQCAADIREKIKVFEAVVWFPKLQGLLNATASRGMRGACRDVSIMTWCCAGRCLIQLERGEHRITLITADTEEPWARVTAHVAPNMGPMGLQGIDAEYVEALKLLYETTRYSSEIELVPDSTVTIGAADD